MVVYLKIRPGFCLQKAAGKSLWEVTVALLLFTGVFCSGCGREEIAADLNPPPQVSFTPRSPDTTLFEEGIDAVPGGDYIHLSWLPGDASDLASYRIYRESEDGGDFGLIAELEAGTVQYEDHDPLLAPDQSTGLTSGFLYWVTALDEAGNESNLSEPEYYRLLPKAVLSQPVFQGDNVILSWSYMQYDPLDFSYYIVRLFRFEGNAWIPFWFQLHDVPHPLETQYTGTPLTAGGSYRYQVDVVGAPVEMPSGSEVMLEFDYP
jgi:hypothetical protein